MGDHTDFDAPVDEWGDGIPKTHRRKGVAVNWFRRWLGKTSPVDVPAPKPRPMWTMKGGEQIAVADMTDSHLANAMRMLERMAAAKCRQTVSDALCCAPPTADMASYYWEQEFDAALDATPEDYLPEIYYTLKDELARRKQATAAMKITKTLGERE